MRWERPIRGWMQIGRGRSLTSLPFFSDGPQIESEAPKTFVHITYLFCFCDRNTPPTIVLCFLETHCDTGMETVQGSLSLSLQKEVSGHLVLNAFFVE